MTLIKTLGLTFIATMAMTAFVGSSSASADNEHVVFCKVAELECKQPFPNPTVISGAATNPKILTTIGTPECEKSSITVNLLNSLSTLLVGHITELTFTGNCHLGSTKCSVFTALALGLLSITKLGPLWASAETTGGTEFTVKCGFLINCTYNKGLRFEVNSTGAGLTTMSTNGALIEGTGLCPEISVWHSSYTISTTMYVES